MLVRVHLGNRYVALAIQNRDPIANVVTRAVLMLGVSGAWAIERLMHRLPRELLAWESLSDNVDVQLVPLPPEARA